jgi:hypothetical protein
MRKKFFKLVEPTGDRKDLNYYFDVFIMSLIILNVLAIILASDQNINARFKSLFYYFEVFSVIVFSIEYLLRLWTCVEKVPFNHPIGGRLKFIFSPMAIIDLLAILPFYLPFVGIDLRFLRILRVFRIFRLLKMARYSNAFYNDKNCSQGEERRAFSYPSFHNYHFGDCFDTNVLCGTRCSTRCFWQHPPLAQFCDFCLAIKGRVCNSECVHLILNEHEI